MKNIKKYIAPILGVAMVVGCFLAHAAVHLTQSFVTGGLPQPLPVGTAPLPQYVLQFPYGVTNYSTNQLVTNNSGLQPTNGWIYWQLISGVYPSPIVGNITSLTLANNGYIDPLAWLAQTAVVTQTNGGISTNTGPSSTTNAVYVQKVAGSTNANGAAVAPPLVDVPLFADANGNINTNATLLIRLNGDQAGATNVITLSFARINSKYNIVDTNNLLSFTMTPNGTNQISLVTNLTGLYNTGCDKLRFWSFGSSTNGANSTFSGTNVFVQVMALQGWVP